MMSVHNQSEGDESRSKTETSLRNAIYIAALVAVIFTAGFAVLRLWTLARVTGFPPGDPTALDRAEEATIATSQILDFLQGAAVLAGLAIGLEALSRARNMQEMRAEVDEQFGKVEQLRKELRDDMKEHLKSIDTSHENLQATFKDKETQLEQFRGGLRTEFSAVEQESARFRETINSEFSVRRAEIERRFADLDNLKNRFDELMQREFRPGLERLDEFNTEISKTQQNILTIFGALIHSQQELSLGNYSEAYSDAIRVLQLDPSNPQALFIAGWLELQYVPDSLDAGLRHLKDALVLRPEWPAVLAALGVGLRRKARKASGNEQRDLFNQSDGYLKQALGQSHGLLDFNRESFWGPVAGNARDMGLIDEAIQAYKNALGVTPGSSYPWGNLASLYMQKSESDSSILSEALRAFRETLRTAQLELAFSPRDYFNMMDIAMSAVMLGNAEPIHFEYADQMLTTALAQSDATDETLCVSLGGWQRLHKYCPDEWIEVKAHLQAAIKRVEAALAKPCPSPDE